MAQINRSNVFGLSLVLLIPTCLLGQQISVYARVDPSEQPYAGQRFTYQIVIEGSTEPGEVDLAPLAQFRPLFLGNENASETSLQLINGRTYQRTITRLFMNYSLVVDQAGPLTIPPVTVTVQGKQYKTNPVQMNLLQPGTTDRLELQVAASVSDCYVGQAVPVIWRLYISLDVDLQRLEFNIPAFTDTRILIDDPEDIPAGARQARICDNVAAYVVEQHADYKGRPWKVITFKKLIIPQQAGQLDLGQSAANVVCGIGLVMPRSFFDVFSPFGTRTKVGHFAVSSGPLKLNVKPLPEAGRPAGFYGLVGKYTIEASARPTEVCVGDPITLTITVKGPYVGPVRWPAWEQIPQMTSYFKIPSERADPEVSNGAKVLVQTIRAVSDQLTAVPSIPLVYFDPELERYVTAKTEPIPIKVMPTKVLTSSDAAGRQIDQPAKSQIEVIREGLAANYEGPQALVHQAFPGLATALTSPLYLFVWAGPVAALLASIAIKTAIHTTPARQAARRRRLAVSQAIGLINKARPAGDAAVVAAALRQFVADRYDRCAGALTPNDCYQIILQATSNQGLASQFEALLDRLDSTRYQQTTQDRISDDTFQKTIDLLKMIEEASSA